MDTNQLCGWAGPVEAKKAWRKTKGLFLPSNALPSYASVRGRTTRLWELTRRVLGDDTPNYKQQTGDCIVADTLISGPRSKRVQDVQVGDEVWTGEGNLTRVVSVREKVASVPLVRIRAVGVDPITCTGDHKFLVYRLGRVNGKRVNPDYAERCASGGKRPNRLVREIFEGRTPVWVPAGEIRDGDAVLTPIHCAPPATPFRPDWRGMGPNGRTLDKDVRYLLGYFAGNGYSGYSQVDITVPEKPKLIARLKSILVGMGYDPREERIDGKNCVRLRFSEIDDPTWFREQFYNRDKEKIFPLWAWGDAAFLDGLWEADGGLHVPSGQHVFDSTSPSLAMGVYHAVVESGFIPMVSRRPGDRGGAYPNGKPLISVRWNKAREKNQVWFDERFIVRYVNAVEQVPDEGVTVYDIGVEDDHHSFLANGVAVHNCVSFGAKNAIEYLSCTEIAAGDRELFRLIFPPYLYATGRVLVGDNRLRGSAGSLGSWMAAAVMRYGTIARDGRGVPDYSGRLADRWGDGADFREFLDRGDDHPVKSAARVDSWDELCAAIGNGYPCTIASNAGYQMKAGGDGYHNASGSWPHQMCVVGVSDDSRRPWAGVLNSWGDVHGRLDDFETGEPWPIGMLRIHRRDMESMIRSGECFAYSRFDGFPAQDLDWGRMGG